jgi:ubiquitin-conjugating enzyme E2 O
MGRINPNLYEDGKICLSILGTWPPKNPDENWSPTKSTVLQIMVSIMGLVLVKDPFYSMFEIYIILQFVLINALDEAGFEAFASEGDSRVEATQYTEKAFVMTRSFIKYALENPISSFQDVLVWHYLPGPERGDKSQRPELLKRVISEGNSMIDHYNSTSNVAITKENAASPFVSRLSLGAVVMLRKHITTLQKILAAAAERSNN